jgi:hypothetical protein
LRSLTLTPELSGAAGGGFCAIVTEANPNNDKDSANVNTRCFNDDPPAVISN